MKRRILTAAGFCLTMTCVSAAPASPGAPATPAGPIDLLEVFARGGIMMFPLALLSVIGVLLVLIYLLTIRRNTVVSDRFMEMADTLLRKRDYAGLTAYCQRRNECIARVVHRTVDFAMRHPDVPFESVREVAQTEGSRQAGILGSRITYLSDIGAIAPMIGLLGTVLGMIKAFIEISQGSVQGVRQMGLAEGVSEALIATAGGLIISIFALGFYSWFRGRVQNLVSEFEAAATHLVALLHQQHLHRDVPHAGAGPRSAVHGPLPGERPDLTGI
jgi:biopolymer transport protein ExbB